MTVRGRIKWQILLTTLATFCLAFRGVRQPVERSFDCSQCTIIFVGPYSSWRVFRVRVQQEAASRKTFPHQGAGRWRKPEAPQPIDNDELAQHILEVCFYHGGMHNQIQVNDLPSRLRVPCHVCA